MQDLKPYNQNLVRETGRLGGVSALTHQAMSNTSAALIIRAAVRAGTHRECSGGGNMTSTVYYFRYSGNSVPPG
ncbi:hypothetical protein Pmar_PMAR027589 [Perkinsus marinus ATCC 50983]|uniref:Uncharacterized protein n=1 Tax=Perkinsus marinus (strain ATCC 50983 / TXsc) TaxID=423536 RepID=C5KC61_PERM5|nr:hypothetical protein Pmar_PMAR027589 [Perkinsus marinus ATCC 50983]EER17874.1 hypothetical protein Pmar_PMAR027589 [Perkinsus marinus ATCC 50983]|eukprot:XP_002786078.1 hypothetical protein Pmar_PMAR027589 [Perkinsus marinus ATCC 50983]